MPIRQIALSLAALAGLTSCGGGGDGSSGAHSQFPSTQADLTVANAPTFARFADLAARAGATMRLGEVLIGAASPFTDGGCFAIGAGQATVTLNASSGPVTGSATYTNFDRCFGMRVNGTADVTGTMQAGNVVDSMNFTFTSLAFSTGTETIQASGTAVLDWTSASGAASYVVTLNATASGAASFRLDNFQISSQITAGVENVSITGRLTTSDGFVDISTVGTPPQLFVPSSGLQGGPVTMTGVSTIATVTYNGPLAPTIGIGPR